MKKFLLTAILIVIISVGVSLWRAGFFNKDNGIEKQEQTRQENEAAKIESIEINDANQLYKITGSYPQIAGAAQLNQEIEEQAYLAINDFKNVTTENWQARKEFASPEENLGEFPEAPFQMQISFDVAQNSSNLISLLLRWGGYSGGAHGYQDLKTFNYNPEQNQSVSLASLFSDKDDYLQIISNFVINDLTEQIKEITGQPESELEASIMMIESGAGPKLENFENFTIKDNTITFYFSPYQVAPYALGEMKVEMN